MDIESSQSEIKSQGFLKMFRDCVNTCDLPKTGSAKECELIIFFSLNNESTSHEFSKLWDELSGSWIYVKKWIPSYLLHRALFVSDTHVLMSSFTYIRTPTVDLLLAVVLLSNYGEHQ